jgi:hypothetical protein
MPPSFELAKNAARPEPYVALSAASEDMYMPRESMTTA